MVGSRWDSRAAMTVSRILARFVRASAVAVLTAIAASGCEEGPAGQGPKSAADPAEQARIEQSKKLVAESRDAFADKKYDDARKLLRQAQELNVESQRFEIEEALDKVDKKQARLWSNEVSEDFKNKNCDGAMKQLETPLKTLAESEVFVRELQKLVGPDALTCLQEQLDQKVLGFDYAGARKVANATATKQVLGAAAWKKLSKELEGTILEGLRGQINADMKAHKWAAAADKIDAAGKKGDATEEQVEALLEGIREGVTPEITRLMAATIGKKDAPAALRQVDALCKVAHWAIVDSGVAGLTMGKALPEELAKKRESLAIWVEAQRMGMAALGRPEARYAHGKVQVSPPNHADGPSKRDIPHGSQVWILGAGKNKALVTTIDPAGARLVDILDKVAGWAPTERLTRDKTLDWLVPDDQLKGERVWGPLRQGAPLWELGVVMDVQGREMTVQRLADGQNFKLPRTKLRSGRLSPGTRVLTFCVAKEQPAQVVEVPPTARTAKLKCDGGQEKEEDLASLRSKPELLPTTR